MWQFLLWVLSWLGSLIGGMWVIQVTAKTPGMYSLEAISGVLVMTHFIGFGVGRWIETSFNKAEKEWESRHGREAEKVKLPWRYVS
jgi:hypothetical protein